MESELFDFCASDLLSEEGLREIIQRHGLTPNNHNHDYVDGYGFFFEACSNERVTEEIIGYLLEYFPHAASDFDGEEYTPLHYACQNEYAPCSIFQLIIDAEPDSVRSANDEGNMPLHILCRNGKKDEANEMKILMLLIESYPEAVRHADSVGSIPIHYACLRRSPEFCRVLIDAYPGSEQITDDEGELPLHLACAQWAFENVKFLYYLFPEAIHHTTSHGYFPIHTAIMGRDINHGDTAPAAVEIVKFLLDCDPKVKFQCCDGIRLLDFACDTGLDHSNNLQRVCAAVEIVKAVYDAHPEAICDNRIVSRMHNSYLRTQAFIHGELRYACQAKDHRLMTTPDMSGRLPLHTAIHNNASLGSIKLLAKGYPAGVKVADNGGALPLHVACMHHDSTDVIQYLVGLDPSTLEAVDRDGDTALHFLCQDAKYDIITLFLEKYGAVSVSKRNTDKKLPIDLLWESNAVVDRESIEYTESMYRLLRANPEMIMGCDVHTMQPSASASTVPCQNEKKRKLGQ